ncbi:hypothetical protein [Ovoidimarina sediminis]|nr:hypothetical protein [Rhodophyticola sp. MJ-SS7]MDU8944941.1 hypothetical protein [Rhodophyticola sp. MJ-SS7]
MPAREAIERGIGQKRADQGGEGDAGVAGAGKGRRTEDQMGGRVQRRA